MLTYIYIKVIHVYRIHDISFFYIIFILPSINITQEYFFPLWLLERHINYVEITKTKASILNKIIQKYLNISYYSYMKIHK